MRVSLLLAMNSFSFFPLVGARVVLALHALAFGASPFQVGLLAAVNQLGALLFSIPVGTFADRHGARGLFLAGMLTCAAALFLPYWFPGLPALYAAAVLLGVWAAIVAVLTQSLIGQLSPPEAVTRNFTNLSLCGSLVTFGAPLVAGYAIDGFGLELAWLALVPFVLVALGFLAACWRTLPAGRTPDGPKARGGRLLADRGLWWVLVLSGATQLCSDLYPFYLPIYGHALGLPASTIGMVVASAALATFAARLLMQPLIARLGEERLLAWSFGLCALGFALVPLFASPLSLALVSLVYGAGSSVGHPLTSSLMFRSSPPGRVGEAMGFRIMANGVLRVFAPGAFGGLATIAGLTAVFLSTGALVGAVAVAAGLRARRHMRGVRGSS